MSEQSRWISVPEAARLIGLSERAARDWIKRHEVPTNGGRPLLVDAAALRRKLADVAGQPRTTPHQPPEGPQMPQEPLEATYRLNDPPPPPDAPLVPLATLLEQSGQWAAEYARLAERLDERGLELGAARNEIGHLKDENARLRAELDAARKPPRTAPEVETPAPEPAPEVPRKWWRRLLP